MGAEWAAKVDTSGGDIMPIILDVTSDESVSAAASSIDGLLQTNNKQLAAVVNNAGVLVDGGVLEASVSGYRFNFDVNVFGVVRVTQKFLPKLGPGGRIVNIGSIAGLIAA